MLFPKKVHLVGIEDKINGALALAKDSAQSYSVPVTIPCYGAIPGYEQVESAKALGLEVTRVLVNGCYQNLVEQSRKERGTLTKKFAV